ncbi:hypothetical protein DVH24_020769 [Malus domestica]|uniref:Uncharacterized protein n=1 Tax=Malus domestica TaxID=3750 RepID=A0A498J9B9_MALDO|nr:hypothetical protein DVH24_020769 [Malus domestica]
MSKIHEISFQYACSSNERDFEISSFDRKSDKYPPPLYHQGGSSSKVGYFKAAHVKINSDELFQNFLEGYKHAIPSQVRVKRVKDDNCCE